MRQTIWLFVLILAIAAVPYGASKGLQSKLKSNWQSAVEKEIPQLRGKELPNELQLNRFCSDPEGANENICGTYQNLTYMAHGAILDGSMGVILLVIIAAAGQICRLSRRLLLLIFKAGLYITICAVVLIITIHAILIMATLYYAESILVHRFHPYIIFAIGVGALTGIGAMLKSSIQIIEKAKIKVVGKLLSTPATMENNQLRKSVVSVANKLGSNPPHNIVVGLEPNFFVTEANVICLDGELTGNTLYISLPLCRILTIGEFESVIGHELGHFSGKDTKFSQKFYPIYMGASNSIHSVDSNADTGYSALALMPAMLILSFFLKCFAEAECGISRKREISADKKAAQVSGSMTIASALVKVHAFSPAWESIQRWMAQALAHNKSLINASLLFAEGIQETTCAESLDGVDQRQIPHPIDSHPPLAIRLRALGCSLADVTNLALQTSPASPAIDLIENYEDLEKEITDVHHAILVRSGQIEVGSALAQEEPGLENQLKGDEDFEKRILCSDGNCTGVINQDGYCAVCGKPYLRQQ